LDDTDARQTSQGSTTGWTGCCFEDFHVGDVYRHPLGRTILSADNGWFTQLTLNTNPVHFDHHYAAQTAFGRPLVNSCFTLSLVTGLSVSDISQNALANLGWDEVRLPHPVFEGDTLYAESEVLETRPSASRANVGIVRVETRGYNQDGTIVITYKRTMLEYRRGHVPTSPRHRAQKWETVSRRPRAEDPFRCAWHCVA
jgi:acyl dehydratase